MIRNEKLILLTEAAKEIPGKNGRLSIRALYRWIAKGVKGARLETVKVGGRVMTSHEAVQRFIAATNQGREPTPACAIRSPAERERAAREAMHRMGY